MDRDILYMRRCIDLARIARGNTSPNPMVGAVIVHKDRIIGQGYHAQAGGPHAEVVAFDSILAEDRPLITESTLYVNLEPCAHHGKTPPCCELIGRESPRRVVVAMEDPFPRVRGKGLQYLQHSGIEVICGVCEQEARELNRHFITAHTLQRPYITLKWAQSIDGFIDATRANGSPFPARLSTPLRQREVHRLRAYHDAILIGNGTLIADNPQLNNRLWWGRSPLRIVWIGQRAIPSGSHLLDGSLPTLLTGIDNLPLHTIPNLETFHLPGENSIEYLLGKLYRRGIISLLVEGGRCLLQQFIDQELYDCVEIETVNQRLYSGVKAPSLPANSILHSL